MEEGPLLFILEGIQDISVMMSFRWTSKFQVSESLPKTEELASTWSS